MVKSKDELIAEINELGCVENVEKLTALIENVADTIEDATSWENKYRENDRQWREKYIERFKGVAGERRENSEEKDSDNFEKITINDLFI